MEKQKCCICGKEFKGYGNSPAPVDGDICCDKCNNKVIIPYRFFFLCEGYSGLLVKNDKLELIVPKKDKFTLKELQKYVGGYIEEERQIFKNCITFADEEGRLKNKEPNSLGRKLFKVDLVGDFIIVPKMLLE